MFKFWGPGHPQGGPYPEWTKEMGDRHAYSREVDRKREGVINTFFTELAERLRGMHIDPREAELSGAFWIGSDGSLQRNNGHCISVDRFVRSIDRIVDYRQVLTLLSQTKYE